MSRSRRARAARGDALTDGEWARLNDGTKPEGTASGDWWAICHDEGGLRPGRPSMRELWAQFGGDVLREWAETRPGERPSLWWEYSAPERQRQRIGGTGTPAHECLGVGLRLHCGVPVDWLQAWQVEYREANGGPPFSRPAFDPRDPPTFESQAAYLDHHALLTVAERRRLTRADFESVAIESSE